MVRKPKRLFSYKCDWCGGEILNTDGGWIVNAEKKRFHDDGIHELCFTKYLKHKEEERRLKEEESAKKKQELYGKKQFTMEEKNNRQAMVNKLEDYLKYLKGKKSNYKQGETNATNEKR